MLAENSSSINSPSTLTFRLSGGDYLVGVKEVSKLCGLSRASIYRRVKDREFPQPIKIGSLTRWSRYEIASWIETLLRDRQSIQNAA